ncbi:MAG TPA: peptidoglycan-binding domain-containing protein, partial [Candidatus Paceibacterota bacterium]
MLKKIAFAGAGLALLASPLISSADTLSDLQAQIQALMAQIAALQGQTQPVAPNTPFSVPPQQPDDYGTGVTAPNYCPKLSITMQRGARDATAGSQVSELQAFLTSYYNLDENIVVGGYFGNLTHKYVVRFQTEQGLPTFGIAGSLTRAKIAQVCGGGTVVPPEPRVCPVAIRTACPTGQHYETAGPDMVDSRGCRSPNLKCVPDTNPIITVNERCTGVTFTSNRRQGDLAADVFDIKKFLNMPVIDTTEYNFDSSTELYVRAFQRKYGLEANAGVWDAMTRAKANAINIQCQPTSGITVTAPNGGEQWEIGQLNTITWTPYGYNPNTNPANDVDVYLVSRMTTCTTGLPCDWYSTIGKVMDTGKASLHTYFNINNFSTWAEPGEYYIRVYNRVTDKADFSDAPFTLLAPRVDLKVNGSNGPISATPGDTIQVSWRTRDVERCRIYGAKVGTTLLPDGAYGNLSPNGDLRGVYLGGHIRMLCSKYDAGEWGDSVSVNLVSVPASLQITSPNGGEQFNPDSWVNGSFEWRGLKSFSYALYKDDMFYAWIAKDTPIVGNPGETYNFSFVPNNVQGVTGLGNGSNEG